MNPPSILVAEDDANDTLLFKRAFSKAAIQVPIIFLRDGEEVIDYLSGQPPFEDRLANPWPALIILDLTMPKVDGLEVLEWMRDQPQCEHIPVLAFSGVQDPTEIGRAYSLGAKFFLIKASDPTHWARVLHRILEMYGLAEPSCKSARSLDDLGQRDLQSALQHCCALP
jgi:Response regulator containing CheY-like receiver, AAA-type ATPase, and DNA-binding domains